MKQIAMAATLVTLILVASCILNKATGENPFCKTEWISDESPLGPFEVATLTLTFGSGDSAVITLDNGPSLKGTYGNDGTTATLSGMDARFSDTGRISDSGDGTITVTFIEAHRNGDTLFLLWRVQDAVYPFTTALRRK